MKTCKHCGRTLSSQELVSYGTVCEDCWAFSPPGTRRVASAQCYANRAVTDDLQSITSQGLRRLPEDEYAATDDCG